MPAGVGLHGADDEVFLIGGQMGLAFAFDLNVQVVSFGGKEHLVPQVVGQSEAVKAGAEVGGGGGDADAPAHANLSRAR